MAREMPKWRILKIGGADVFVRPTLLVMAALLILVFSPQFTLLHEGNGLFVATLFVIVLYLSILMHEFGHLLIARIFGFHVPTIELHLMGGHTIIEGRSKYASQEFLIAFIGPLMSAAIGSTLLLAQPMMSGYWSTLFWSIGVINLFLAFFNVLPSAPLDGGRMVRAVAWALTRSEITGIKVATFTGRVTAVALALAAPFLVNFSDRFDIFRLLILWFLAAYLWRSSGIAQVYDLRSARISTLSAKDLMKAPELAHTAVRISAELRGAQLLKAMAENPAPIYALVDPEGRAIGSLLAEDVDRAYLEAT